MNEPQQLRRLLHRHAERSGCERETARLVRETLAPLAPHALVEGLGGHGVAAAFGGPTPGPTVLVRCELDALPIPETVPLDHASHTAGVAHKCGHDGHMAVVLGLAARLHARPPRRGRAVLLFQPAEETGVGAARVLADPAFAPFRPDRVFALHNLPGFARGAVVLRDGPFASASRGLAVRLGGATAHASEPQRGRSPAPAVARLLSDLPSVPQYHTALHEAAQVTVIHARLGEIAFGTSPGEAVVMATLRAHEPAVLERLAERCTALARAAAVAHGLAVETEWVEPFPATVNDDASVALVEEAARSLGLPVVRVPVPFAWSEDFGHFTAAVPGALFGLGAGDSQPALHHPSYDFPDEILVPGIDVCERVVRRLLDDESG